MGAGGKGAKKLEIQRKEVHTEADWRGRLFREKENFLVGRLENHIERTIFSILLGEGKESKTKIKR